MVSTVLLGESLERLLDTNLMVLQELKTLRRDVNQLREEVTSIKQFITGIQFELSQDASNPSMETVEMTSSAPAVLLNDRQPWMRRGNHPVPITLDSAIYKPPSCAPPVSTHLPVRPLVLSPIRDVEPSDLSTSVRTYTISPKEKEYSIYAESLNHSQASWAFPSTRSISFTESEESTQYGSIFEGEPSTSATRYTFPLRKWRHVTSLSMGTTEKETQIFEKSPISRVE